MISQEKDKFIVEWFGECWHESAMDGGCNLEWQNTTYYTHCEKCGCTREYRPHPDFTTPEGFFWLWKGMRTTLPAASTLWRDFLIWLDERDSMPADFQVINLIDNRTKFRDTVYEFLQTQKEGR